MKKVLGSEIGLALDCGQAGPSRMPSPLPERGTPPHRVARRHHHGRLHALSERRSFREVTVSTTIPIHTGEEIYLSENFKDLIEKQAVNIVGPNPEDVGGIAEMKWIAEYADIHGIQIAPHGVFDGLIGLAAHVQVAAALPQNYIAFEYPLGQPDWWYEIVEGLPNPIVERGFIKVWDRPGLGVTLNAQAAKSHLSDEEIVISLTETSVRGCVCPALPCDERVAKDWLC